MGIDGRVLPGDLAAIVISKGKVPNKRAATDQKRMAYSGTNSRHEAGGCMWGSTTSAIFIARRSQSCTGGQPTRRVRKSMLSKTASTGD